jgi:hypothetical protein
MDMEVDGGGAAKVSEQREEGGREGGRGGMGNTQTREHEA